MRNPNERNQRVIDEFRGSGGSSATYGADRPIILLTTTGRKSGLKHTTPVMYRREGDRLAVFATKGGAPTSPDWYHNLVANPTVTVEVGAETFDAEASVAEGAEHDRIYALHAQEFPQFGDYQKKTTRQIPVVILERKS